VIQCYKHAEIWHLPHQECGTCKVERQADVRRAKIATELAEKESQKQKEKEAAKKLKEKPRKEKGKWAK
jgi:hypothetical protein